ncbi:MAG: phosphoribosylaminoimidazolesuccinocarboxamide synthase, partial [Acidobacteriota bacterium]
MTAVTETRLPGLHLIRRGKVRELYDLGDTLLLVATDRISAFDCVLSPGIPDKGRVLTSLSNFWFDRFVDVENHIL